MQRRLLSDLTRCLTSRTESCMASLSTTTNTEERKSSFGFRQVDPEEKPNLVGDVFRSVADRYDVMNDVMSCGIHRWWKEYYVSQIPLSSTMRHLDVAGGTGDIAFRLLDRLPKDPFDTSEVVVCDLSPEMIEAGKKRVRREERRLKWVLGDAEALEFPDGSFDSYTIAFGIRNVTHIDRVLREAYRVLKPGGYFSCLEFSHIQNSMFRSLYDLYSFNIIPVIGQAIVGDHASYRYLVESIRSFPKQEPFANMIHEAGFRNVVYENLMNGIVSIHSGRKGVSQSGVHQ